MINEANRRITRPPIPSRLAILAPLAILAAFWERAQSSCLSITTE
ncbi:MAG TPA: hypothetical protein VHM25_23855 [Polyangiaceae bacterium]|nr:hypothetical protein [Polyangiaceae bacterium]